MILEKADQLEAVDVRDVEVGEDRLEFVVRQKLEGLESIRRLHDLDAGLLRPALDDVREIGAHRCGVFNEKDLHQFSRSAAALSKAAPACDRKISSPVRSSIGARCSALSP